MVVLQNNVQLDPTKIDIKFNKKYLFCVIHGVQIITFVYKNNF